MPLTNMFGLRQIIFEELEERNRSVEQRALLLFLVDSLIIALTWILPRSSLLFTNTTIPWDVFRLLVVLVAFAACLCAAFVLRVRSMHLMVGRNQVSSYDEMSRILRDLSGDSILEELDMRIWERQKQVLSRRIWLNLSLALSILALLLLLIYQVPFFVVLDG
mgnify:CR=1 FL=1